MSYQLSASDRQLLESLVGKKIHTSGSCSSQDGDGVASTGDMAPATGILTAIEYDPETNEPAVLVIADPTYGPDGIKILIKFEDDKSTWNIHRGIYLQGKEVIEFSPGHPH